MSTHRIINQIFLATFALIIFSTSYAAQFGAPGPMPMAGGISAEMQEEMKKFEEEFANLDPKEQDEFFASLDDAVKKIDELSKTQEGKEMLSKLESGAITDEELDSLINQLVEDDPVKKEDEPVAQTKEEQKPQAPKQVLTSKHEKAIAAINSLIASINSSIVKAATVPEFPSKLKSWIKKKQVLIQPSKAWNEVKVDLERLVEQLSLLLERDPKTANYYHIDALLKNESLLNNIQKIESAVAQFEPRAEEVPLLGGRRMKNASKRAYHSLLNEYNEALYILNLTQELKTLFTLFDPVAKTYREAEDKAVKAAGSKKPVAYSGAPGRYTAPVSDSYGGGYDDYGYDDYAPGGYSAQPAYIPSASSRRYSPSAVTQAQPGQQRPGQRRQAQTSGKSGSSKPGETKDGKLGESKDEKSKDEPKIEIPKEMQALQKEIDGSLKKIQDKFKDAADIISEQKMLQKVDTEFIDESPINTMVVFETLPDLNKALNMQKGVLGDIHQLHRKIKPVATRQSVQKKLQRAYDKHKKELNGLLDALSALESKWEVKSEKMPEEKRVTYFGMKKAEKPLDDESQKEQPDQSKEHIISSYSFFDIQKGIKRVKSAIADFAKAKLPKE